MKFLIINTDYPEFISWFYKYNPGFAMCSYEEQAAKRFNSLFQFSDFYSKNLQLLGHEAVEVFANNEIMQRKWAFEHKIKVPPPFRWKIYKKGNVLPYPRRVADDRWLYYLLREQVKFYKPDILYVQAMPNISTFFLSEIKRWVRLVVGQHAATDLSGKGDFNCYDLVLSSFPQTVERFRSNNIPSERLRLGFEPKVLECLNKENAKVDISFVGGFHAVHTSRVEWLESICSQYNNIKVWSGSANFLPASSLIHRYCIGEAWGRDMFQVLCNSKITLNHHGDVAPYANNLRLYEATGVGAMLLTDWKNDICELFEPGKEIVTYRSTEECLELIQYYLDHDNEREAIAKAGQKRTLSEHTYYKRMCELLAILKAYI
jgi:hypothetical protein